MYRGLFSSALASHWRREVLRTSLWFVPSLEVLAAIGLFVGTLAADRAAYQGDFALRAADAAELHPGPRHAADAGDVRGDVRLLGAGAGRDRDRVAGRLRTAHHRARAPVRHGLAAGCGAGDLAEAISEQGSGAVIDRAGERSVPEAADRADIRRRYEAILIMESVLTAGERKT